MSAVEDPFQHQIEVEGMWLAAADQNPVITLSSIMLNMLFVYALWDTAAHTWLLGWLVLTLPGTIYSTIHFPFYRRNKALLSTELSKFKYITLTWAGYHSLVMSLFVLIFLDTTQPLNILLVSVVVVNLLVGMMLAWYYYLPFVIVTAFPATLILVCLLVAQGGTVLIVVSMLFVMFMVFTITHSIRLKSHLNQALRLGFENAALRQAADEQSLLLETALQNMNQGISMTDPDDHLRMWNRQFSDLFAVAGAENLNHSNFSALLKAADPPLGLNHQPITEYQLSSGQVYEIRQQPLAQGGRVVTYTDITEATQREQALELARKAAEQANAAKTRFLAAASHDLRQPIHALGLFFGELADRVHSPETAPVIAQIDESITAINSMLNALLDVSKLDAGVVSPVLEAYPLTELFTRLEAEFKPMAAQNHNQLRIQPSLAVVNTDPAMLERMLRNLIGNALSYTQHGRIVVAAKPCGNTMRIRVLDNGIGIPHQQLDDIFVEFHQLHNPARDRRQGLGLGLAIVKRLAALLGHKINVVSHPGRGSCFSITLPVATVIATPKVRPTVESRQRAAYSLAGLRVLVLDDDRAVLDGMCGLLGRWGCSVIAAASPDEAVVKLSEHKAATPVRLDLLIIDYRLPFNVSGIEVAKNLQARLGYPVSVLIITGDTGPERLREAEASGYPLLHKPVQPTRLRSTLQYLMAKRT